MIWDFDGDGVWEAFSSIQDDEMAFEWRIVVCEDGTFSVAESDPELTDREETFDTLRDAKSWCEEREKEFILACKREVASE